MKRILLLLVLFFAAAPCVTAQRDSVRSLGRVTIVTIENGDTVITEKNIPGGGIFGFQNPGGRMTPDSGLWSDLKIYEQDSLLAGLKRMLDSIRIGMRGGDFPFGPGGQFGETPFDSLFAMPGLKITPFKTDSFFTMQKNPPHRPPGGPMRNIVVEDMTLPTGKKGKGESFVAIPDPARGELSLSILVRRNRCVLQIDQVDGDYHFRETVPVRHGLYTRRIPLGGMSSGAYILSVKQGKRLQTKKMMIQ